MKQYINVLKLLSMITQAKDKVDTLYNNCIDPETSNNSKLMASIYNDITKCSLNGTSIDITKESILHIDKIINEAIINLEKLQCIKDDINRSNYIYIHSINDKEKLFKVSVSTALYLTNKKNREYRIGYIDKLVRDLNIVMGVLKDNQSRALSQDKIDTYVKAKMTSLSIVNNSSTYNDFAKEYIDANKFSVLDPLDIANRAQELKSNIMDYYDDIESSIKVFNATCKIWIDLDSDEYWGLA